MTIEVLALFRAVSELKKKTLLVKLIKSAASAQLFVGLFCQ